MFFFKQFIKELTFIIKILKLRVVFRPCEINDNVKAANLDSSLINMPE